MEGLRWEMIQGYVDLAISNHELRHHVRKPRTAKTQEYDERFDRFYAAYPQKKSPGQAERTWGKINPDGETFLLIMAEAKRMAVAWKIMTAEEKKHVQHPSTWLNAKGWLNETDDRDDSGGEW